MFLDIDILGGTVVVVISGVVSPSVVVGNVVVSGVTERLRSINTSPPTGMIS